MKHVETDISRDNWVQSLIVCLALSLAFSLAVFLAFNKMTRYACQITIGPKVSGYIRREKLEKFLEERFPRSSYPGAAINRFEIKVVIVKIWFAWLLHVRLIVQKEKNDRWAFYAPEEIPEASSIRLN